MDHFQEFLKVLKAMEDEGVFKYRSISEAHDERSQWDLKWNGGRW